MSYGIVQNIQNGITSMANYIDNSVLNNYTTTANTTITTNGTSIAAWNHNPSTWTTTTPIYGPGSSNPVYYPSNNYQNYFNELLGHKPSRITRNRITKSDIFIVHDLDVPNKDTKVPQNTDDILAYFNDGFLVSQIRYNKEYSRLEYKLVQNTVPEKYKDENVPLKLPLSNQYKNLDSSLLPPSVYFLGGSLETLNISNFAHYYTDMLFDSAQPENIPLTWSSVTIAFKETKPNPSVFLPEYSYITIKPMAELVSVPNVSFKNVEDLLTFMCPIKASIIPDLANAMRYSANMQSDIENAESYILNAITTLILNNLYY